MSFTECPVARSIRRRVGQPVKADYFLLTIGDVGGVRLYKTPQRVEDWMRAFDANPRRVRPIWFEIEVGDVGKR